MDPRIPATQTTPARSHPPRVGDHPQSCRKPAGRPPLPGPDQAQTCQALIRVLRAVFPDLVSWLNALPDPRVQEMCRYTAAHLWWEIIAMYLFRCGSRNLFDQQRQTGQAAWNLGELCGQAGDDPRFAGKPLITGSDNAARHANRVDPAVVAGIVVQMMRHLLQGRKFDAARLFDTYYVLVVDGTVQEKCRAGFGEAGKTGAWDARFRYMLQVSLLGPQGLLFPLMHEAMDLQDPVADKEDCELKSFQRLAVRLKQAFPRLSFCLVGDALYACQAVLAVCQRYDWKYILTLKEGRQPTTWEEMLHLLPLHTPNQVRLQFTRDRQTIFQGFRWVEDVMLGEFQTHVILQGETTPDAATLFGFITNLGNLTPERVVTLVNHAGRKRHTIEDIFNTQKNHGIGLEHVFRAHAAAAKNYYTMMQVAQILWHLVCHGCLRRLYDWARRTTQLTLARLLWEGLRGQRLPPDLPPLGQLRFCSA